MEFSATKRENFFLSLTSLELMLHDNEFLNNSTRMMKIKGPNKFQIPTYFGSQATFA